MVQGCGFQVPGLGSRFARAHDARVRPALVLSNQERRTKNLEPGTWNLEPRCAW
jgi:hypothetical protein